MLIRFRTSVSSDRGAFVSGQQVQVRAFPMEWQGWLEAGVIEVIAEDRTERAVTPEPAQAAVLPRGRRRGERSKKLAE